MAIPTPVRRPLPRGGAKVKAPKRHTQSLDDAWIRLGKAITEIQHHNASKLSFEELYRQAYNMVLYKQGTKLFMGVRDIVAQHLDDEVINKISSTLPYNVAGLPTSEFEVSGSSTSSSPCKEKGKGRADPPGGGEGPTVPGGSATSGLARAQEGERFLKAIREIWEDHVACMKKLRDVLKYMDKVYTTSPGNGHPSMPTVWDLGLFLFLTHVVRSTRQPIGPTLLMAILAQIRLDREGEAANRSVIKSCVDMLCDLSNASRETVIRIADVGGGLATGAVPADAGESVYKTDFEGHFLAESAEFYRLEGEKLIAVCDAPEYLYKVERRLREEEIRLQHYLHPSTEQPLTDILNEFLITAHIPGILGRVGSGLDHMIEANAISDLNRMYRLFGRVPPAGHANLRDGIKQWIKDRGLDINKGLIAAGGSDGQDGPSAVCTTNAALQWVQNVLDLRDKSLRLLGEAFASDKTFQTSANEAFTSFINTNRRAPEYVSLFLDDNLKKGLKGKTEVEVDHVLEKTIALFRYLSDKDVFERYYKGHLAKRLLFGRSISDDAERSMLAKLKVECGAAFTRDLEGMLKDIKMSTEMAKSFKDWSGKPGSPRAALDLTVTVGSSSMWPMTQTKSSCIFPKEFQDAIKSYERFYGSRHSGRKLAWHGELGNVDLKARFNKTAHELNISTFAAVVLMQFQNLGEHEELSFMDIKTSTAIPDSELRRTLQSLACAKYRILSKSPKGREINDGDSFAFHANFSAPLARIKILTVTNKVETGQEAKETQDRVEEDRRLITEACIVRIMKTRKTLGFIELNNEVITQLSKRFNPSAMVIKTAVEKLIEKDYLVRDPNDRKILTYLA